MRLRRILDSLDIGKTVPLLWTGYTWRGYGHPGRPPHDPQGMLFAFVLLLVKGWSYRDAEVFLGKNEFWLRRLRFRKAPDHTCFSDFLDRLGPEVLHAVFRDLVCQLAEMGVLRLRTAVPDSVPLLAQRSDYGADWGHSTRLGKFRGYKTHAMAAARSELPIAFHLTHASPHDSQPFPRLLEQVLGLDIERMVADSAYDSAEIKMSCVNAGIEPVIQKNPRGHPGPGRPEKKGSRKFRKRSAVERMFARLLDWFHLRKLRWRGTERVASVVLVAFIGMLWFAVLGKKMQMSPRAVRSILRELE